MIKKRKDIYIRACDNCKQNYEVHQYQYISGFCSKCEELPLVIKIIQLQQEIEDLRSEMFNLRHYGDDNYGY